LFAQAGFTLIAIAIVHSDNRAGAAIAMRIFATGVAVSVLLIASHDRPFSGEISVKPDVLLQVIGYTLDVCSPFALTNWLEPSGNAAVELRRIQEFPGGRRQGTARKL
jgi:hypothetical protein